MLRYEGRVYMSLTANVLMIKTRTEDPQVSWWCASPWNVVLSPFSALTLLVG